MRTRNELRLVLELAVRDTPDMDTAAAMTTVTAWRRSVPMATTAMLRMLAPHTGTTVRPGSAVASSSVPVLGSAAATMAEGTTVAEATTVEVTAMVEDTDTVADIMAADARESTGTAARSVILVASPVAARAAAPLAASTVERVVVSTAVAVAVCMAVAVVDTDNTESLRTS